jgi:hypothetical protein
MVVFEREPTSITAQFSFDSARARKYCRVGERPAKPTYLLMYKIFKARHLLCWNCKVPTRLSFDASRGIANQHIAISNSIQADGPHTNYYLLSD